MIEHHTSSSKHKTLSKTVDTVALENIASIYDKENLVIDNLTVKGKIKVGNIDVTGNTTTNTLNSKTGIVTPSATIGKMHMRGNAIGLPNVTDINIGTDGWIRSLKYGQPQNGAYTPLGFASTVFWADGKLV